MSDVADRCWALLEENGFVRLTDEEREAVKRASDWLVSEMWADSDEAVNDAAALRGLLARAAKQDTTT